MPNDLLPDLLGRIAAEIDERLRSLWPAVQEFERLRADLRALEGEMEVADETIDTALAAPVADGASAADVAPEADVIQAEVAAPVSNVMAMAEVAAPVPDVVAATEVTPPIAEVASVAERVPPREAPRPRPLLSPKVLRLMDSPGRGPLRGRGVGRARRPAAPVADRLGMGGGASKHA